MTNADQHRPHKDTALDLRIRNALHSLNLSRIDIAALPDGSTIACNITTHRILAALLEDILRDRPTTAT